VNQSAAHVAKLPMMRGLELDEYPRHDGRDALITLAAFVLFLAIALALA
jgi:hypothetical protein